MTSKPTETMLVSQAPPEHGPEPGTTAEAASQGTAAEARKPEASPVFSFKSPQSYATPFVSCCCACNCLMPHQVLIVLQLCSWSAI